MIKLKLSNETPGLLVSVRSAAEALTALAGGADVIDVKEPNRGSLGAADDNTISDIVRAVDGRAPVSAALGELVDLIDSPNGDRHGRLVDGVSLFKIGLARCATLNDWQARWQHATEAMVSTSSNRNAQPVAVVYADWRAAQSPSPHDILQCGDPVPLPCPAHRHLGQVGRNALRSLAGWRSTRLSSRSAVARYLRRAGRFIDRPKRNRRSATGARSRRRPYGSVRRRSHGNGLGDKGARTEECYRNVYTKHGRFLKII